MPVSPYCQAVKNFLMLPEFVISLPGGGPDADLYRIGNSILEQPDNHPPLSPEF